MRAAFLFVVASLTLSPQDETELRKQIQRIADRACDLDPAIREDAAKEAAKFYDDHREELGRSKDAPALIVLALAGKKDARDLFKLTDKAARQVACDRMTVSKDHVADLLKLVEDKDLGMRLAACRALGRATDPVARQQATAWFSLAMRKRGAVEVLYYYYLSLANSNYPYVQSFIGDPDAARAELAIAAMCNLPRFTLAEGTKAFLVRALANEKIDPQVRLLLVRVLGRMVPSVLLGLLTTEDRALRSEIVDALDRGLTEPLHAQALFDASREGRLKGLDDGKDPSRPLLEWVAQWLKRLCGEGVTLDNFEEWIKKNHKTMVDKQVDAAIKKGVAGLRKLADKDGCWSYSNQYRAGVTALAVYALLKCDVPVDDEAVAKGLDLLLDKDPEGTYSAGLVALALSAAIEKRRAKKGTSDQLGKLEKRLQKIADVLVASQTTPGGWSYAVNLKTGTGDYKWASSAYDLSNTQFGVLGLRACVNGGAKVPRKTWERALALYEKLQSKDGGWGYMGNSGASSRMTAAGATSWMICKMSLDEKLEPEAAGKTERMKAAFKFLEKQMDAESGGVYADYYWLYSLERACMTAKVEKVGSHDWYYEGAAVLLKAQGADGTWTGGYQTVVDTCFALLFLRRAYVTRDVETETIERRATPEKAAEVFRNRHESLRKMRGVVDVQVDKDERTSFIRVVVESEAAARELREKLGKELDGVPLRIIAQ